MYKAGDFDGAWQDVPAGQLSEHNEAHRRHILDKEVLADILNIADVTLNTSQFNALKAVINNGKINMHLYQSKGANVGHTKDYAEKNDVNEKIRCDKHAVNQVKKSFEEGKDVFLSAHEASHIDAQSDVLLDESFKDAFQGDINKYHKVLAAYLIYTAKVKGPSNAQYYTDGKVVDGRKFKQVTEATKNAIRKTAKAYLQQKLDQAQREKQSCEEEYGQVSAEATTLKESNDMKYNCLVPYNRHGGGSGSGGGNRDDPLQDLIREFNASMHLQSSSSYYPSLPTLGYGDGWDRGISSFSYNIGHSSSSSSSVSVNSSIGSGTRAGSSWDHFRSNVWTGGSRAEMSRAYQAWKSGRL